MDTDQNTNTSGGEEERPMVQREPDTSRDDHAREDEPLREAGMRALEREREERKAAHSEAAEARRRAEAAEARLAEFERAQMSEQERVASERDEWRGKYEEMTAKTRELEIKNLRHEVATAAGIPMHANRLVGSTREELEADAEAFKASLPQPIQPERDKYVDPSAGASASGGRAGSVAEAMAAYRASRNRNGNPE